MTGTIGAAGTMVLLAVPSADTAPAALVAVQRRARVPGPLAVKVTLVPVVAEVIVPPVMVQEKVMPPWGAVSEAVLPVVLAMTVVGALMTGSSGIAATATEVLANLLASSAEVAVMLTTWAADGAVQAPVAGFMVPALADQVRVLVAPPVAAAEKMVVVPTVRLEAAGVMAPTLTD